MQALAALLEKARCGDAAAFCEIARQHEEVLFRQACALCLDSHSAEDLVQETLLEAWKCIARYDGSCRFSTWLYAILLHRWQKSRRKWCAVRAFAMIPPDLDLFVLDPAKMPPDEQAKKAVDAYSPALKLLAQGAGIKPCDWGIDFSVEGPQTLLPQLSKAGQLSRGACFAARYEWATGHKAKAVEHLRNAVIMGRHVGAGKDGTLISILAQTAIEQRVIGVCAEHLADADAAAALEPVIKLGNVAGRHLASEAVLGEKKLIRPGLAAGMMILLADPTAKDYDEMARVLALPYEQSQTEMKALAASIDAKPNPFSKAMLRSISRTYEQQMTLDAKWAMLDAAIAICKTGPDALKDAKNPLGTGPFQYKKLDAGFELSTTMPGDGKPIVLTFGKPQ